MHGECERASEGPSSEKPEMSHSRVVFAHLQCVQGDPTGWLQPPVELILGSSGSWRAATVATNCPTAHARWRN